MPLLMVDMLISTSMPQFSKANEPIDTSGLGIFNVLRLVQFLKASEPIEVTEFGMLIDSRREQSKNAAS